MRIRDGSSDVCSSDLRVEQLLALAQVEAAAVSLDQAVDLAAVARETITRLVPLALDSDHLLGLETAAPLPARGHPGAVAMILQRSEERRVGNEGVSTCRARGSPYP